MLLIPEIPKQYTTLFVPVYYIFSTGMPPLPEREKGKEGGRGGERKREKETERRD